MNTPSNELWVYVNGIHNSPGARGWTDRAVIWTHNERARLDHFKQERSESDPRRAMVGIRSPRRVVGDKFEYWAGALTRRVGQDKRAQALASILNDYKVRDDWSINIMAHSNGADVVVRLLNALDGDINFSRIHLVAPACESDFEQNGFCKHLASGAVHRIYVHWADKDKAMNLAKISSVAGSIISTAFPFFGQLGYGYLGLDGPDLDSLPEPLRHRVIGRRYRGWGHSTFWEPANFDNFMLSAHAEP